MEGSQHARRTLTGTMFMAMVVYKLPADRYEQEFAKDWDLWEDVLRTLVVRFLANSSGRPPTRAHAGARHAAVPDGRIA